MTDLWHGALIDTAIWHRRSGDIERTFRYRATYLAVPLAGLEAGALPLSLDRAGIWSLRRRDYGMKRAEPLTQFATTMLEPVGLAGTEITLITQPRTMGYGFNPVSFWLARDGGGLRAVIAEVSNTFGERHFYLCRHADNRPIAASDRLYGNKLFHVSPFLPRKGQYRFRFDPGPGRFGAWVDWLGPGGEVVLGTSMSGKARPLTAASLRGAQMRSPLQAQRVMALIHWQAAKLFRGGATYRPKPTQLAASDSTASKTTRNDDV